jgi:hypothetical protein
VAQFPGSRSITDLEPVFQQRVRRFLDAIASARAGLPNANAPVAIANANGRPGAPNGMGRVPGQAAQVAAVPRAPVANVHPRVQINATFRPAQRAYMMHYCWLINRNRISPADVPRYQPIGNQTAQVDIDWVHRDPKGKPDLAASRRAALQMVNGFGIANLRVAPALNSNHVNKRAIDMDISWRGNVEIADVDGNTVLIDTLPRDGTNRRLIEVGAAYGVYHLGLVNGVLNQQTVNRDRPHWSDDGR